VNLSGTGVWAGQLRYGDEGAIADAAAELDALGYSALWIPDVGGDVLAAMEHLLGAAPRAAVATGILNVWMHTPDEIATRRGSWSAEWQARALFGLGVSHAALIDQSEPGKWTKPYSVMVEYLDGLDAASPSLPKESRALAALGPRMLKLARDRTTGVHPYLVPPEHSAVAREAVGPHALVATEQAVVLETDAAVARAIARQHLAIYLGLPNYTNNLLRLGFTEDDVAAPGSDRLVDAIVAWGDVDAIKTRVDAQRAAGANHVCIQVLQADYDLPSAVWRELAPALTGSSAG
jgi:probable F420-dependent oxidoreductase